VPVVRGPASAERAVSVLSTVLVVLAEDAAAAGELSATASSAES
jgi:hypothetical protein